MLRWMLVFTDQDTDTLALFRSAPRRFFPPLMTEGPSISLADAPTRYGIVNVNLTVLPDGTAPECTGSAQASVEMQLHGRGYIGTSGAGLTVELRLRAHGGACVRKSRLAKASVTAVLGDLGPLAVFVDRQSETVTLALSTRLPRGCYKFRVAATFS